MLTRFNVLETEVKTVTLCKAKLKRNLECVILDSA